MKRIQKIVSSVQGSFLPDWMEFLHEDLEGYELVRVRPGRYPEEEPVYFVLGFARKLGFSVYQDFLTVRQVLSKTPIYLFLKHKTPYGMYIPGITEVRGRGGNPITSRRDYHVYDILLSLKSLATNEVDWRPDEMLPEDYYST